MRKVIAYILILLLAITSFVYVIISYLNICYPIKYIDIVSRYSFENNLDVKTVLSIINIESSFESDSISEANAIGLMQLKLSTASDMAKLCNESVTRDKLFDKETNIKYGCKYIRYLLDYYDNNLILSLCAYNAGLGNVNYWLSEDKYLKNKICIDNIPFQETKDYIIKYNRNYKVYSYLEKIGKVKS